MLRTNKKKNKHSRKYNFVFSLIFLISIYFSYNPFISPYSLFPHPPCPKIVPNTNPDSPIHKVSEITKIPIKTKDTKLTKEGLETTITRIMRNRNRKRRRKMMIHMLLRLMKGLRRKMILKINIWRGNKVLKKKDRY